MTGALADVLDVGKVLVGALGGGAILRVFQWRSQTRLVDAQADVQEATADATETEATAKLIAAATQTVAATGPLLSAEIARQSAQVDRLAAELTELRGEVLRMMGRATEDRVQIHTLSAELAAERARSARTDAYLVALRAWASDAVREIRRLDGTISDPPAPYDPPSPPPVPAPRPPSD